MIHISGASDSNFYMPVKVISGEDCVAAHSGEFAALGRRCLIVTGKASARKSGALGDCIAALTSRDIAYRVYDGVTQNPLLSSCGEAGREAAAFGADFIVGIGGGSPLDAAKAAAVLAANDMQPEELYSGGWKYPALPFILIGTTAGTGSEVTAVSVLTNDRTGRKKSFAHRGQTYARVAFCDPKYTYSLGREFTVSTALDALSHAIEGYYSAAANTVSDMFALLSVGEVYPALLSVGQDGSASEETRRMLYYGSIHAGMTLNHCGTCFCHQFGYFLSENHGIPHGFACAATLPEFLLRGKRFLPEKAAALESAAGCSTEKLCEDIDRLNSAELPHLTLEQIDALIPRYENAKHLRMSPGGFSVQDTRELFINKFLG